ncbi:RHS repeat-associated core domain-containing protein [Serratia fonticola]|uniref:RHS repeat-associated core domain-containing protein n=1 Tax=Serratia fonticola TaxID=47917 RepID=UPI0027E787C3|nr:RHS repeat-associated core domain-containing protein [Serratia fonticola]MDQ7211679.1 RHS repeat-associated core domain-containing protein [Serratia fonticola]
MATTRYQNDHLNTSHNLTDNQGNTLWRGQYNTYGQLTEEWTPPDARDEHPQPKVNNPLRFQGQYEDAESGLYYNVNRYYDPGVGRYLTAEPVKLEGGLNSYQYVDGNPVSLIDPLGLSPVNSTTSTAPEPKVSSPNGDILVPETEFKPDFIVSPNGTVMSTNKDVKLGRKINPGDRVMSIPIIFCPQMKCSHIYSLAPSLIYGRLG